MVRDAVPSNGGWSLKRQGGTAEPSESCVKDPLIHRKNAMNRPSATGRRLADSNYVVPPGVTWIASVKDGLVERRSGFDQLDVALFARKKGKPAREKVLLNHLSRVETLLDQIADEEQALRSHLIYAILASTKCSRRTAPVITIAERWVDYVIPAYAQAGRFRHPT